MYVWLGIQIKGGMELRKAFYTSNAEVLNKLDSIENQSQYINQLILDDIHRDLNEKGFYLDDTTMTLLLTYLLRQRQV